MNKYLIKCINDCSISYAVAYASSLDDLTEEDIRRVVDSINWEEYYNYSIAPFEGTDEEFNTYPLIYDGRNVDELYPEVLRLEDSITEC